MNEMIYDLLIIGGGINGAGIARDAAGRGLSVALCEQNDFASATSSASTKLIHGGLRYLEYKEFRLVAEALSERENILNIAPHITTPLRFVIPHVKGLRPRWLIRFGLWLYDHIGGKISLPKSHALNLKKDLPAPNGLGQQYQHGFIYSDVHVDDARLVIFNLKSAVQYGAHIFSRTKLIHAERKDELWLCQLQDMQTKQVIEVKSKTLVNTAGPWVAEMDRLLHIDHEGQAADIKLVRGSHIVVPKVYEGEHAFILQNLDKRIVFMIPYENDFTLIGTTDVPQNNMQSGVHITQEEEIYLLEAVNRYLDKKLARHDIVWRYSGVRPLYDDHSDNPSAVTRDYTLVLHDQQNIPCVSVYGGKITTYRRLAESVLDKLQPWLGKYMQHQAWTATEPLPGGQFKRDQKTEELKKLTQSYPSLDPTLLTALFDRHGLLVYRLLQHVKTPADLGQDFGGSLTETEVMYFIQHEWATTPEDVLWRRTKCGLHMSIEQRQAVEHYFSRIKQR